MASAIEPERKKSKIKFEEGEYYVRKRLPNRLPKRNNDIYVSNKNFKCQVIKCKKLLENGENEVFIHGLGNAINSAINCSLQIQAEYGGALEISSNTSTEGLVDDLEPLMDNLEPQVNVRNNSAIHIKLYRLNPIDFKLKKPA